MKAVGGALVPVAGAAGARSLIAQAQAPAADTVRATAGAPLAGSGSLGRLADPTVLGPNQSPTQVGENEEAIKQIELKLACRCGCTLDVFTCRTTDFSCTYSPAMHREVVAMYQGGSSAQQILDSFVAEYGEKVLMAPPAKGFNLAGYFVPGIVIALFGALLVWIIGRRRSVALANGGAPGTLPGGGAGVPPAQASPEEMERLQQALAEVED